MSMESRLMTVTARRLTVCQSEPAARASGGRTCYYTSLPPAGPTRQQGVILRLDDYRTAPVCPPKAHRSLDRPARPVKRHRLTRLGLLLDGIATMAVLAVAVGALACFSCI